MSLRAESIPGVGGLLFRGEKPLRKPLTDRYIKGPVCLAGANVLHRLNHHPDFKTRLSKILADRGVDTIAVAAKLRERNIIDNETFSRAEDFLTGMAPWAQIAMGLLFVEAELRKMGKRQITSSAS